MSEEGIAKLSQSMKLTDTILSCRQDWDRGKGKDYGTACAFLTAFNKRQHVIRELRSMFRLVGGTDVH